MKKTARKASKSKPATGRRAPPAPAAARGPAKTGSNSHDRDHAEVDGADQFGAIIAKGMDLAEAGLSLGLTIIGRVGAVAQRQLLNRISLTPEPVGGRGDSQPATGESAASDVRAEQEQQFFITNRLPAAPGGEVSVSFSINNDAIATRKKVSLSVDGFTGEQGGRLEGRHFSVKPSTKMIEPMDFDKFVLAGTVPPQTVPDVYNGWVMVKTDSEFRIPVRLVIVAI